MREARRADREDAAFADAGDSLRRLSCASWRTHAGVLPWRLVLLTLVHLEILVQAWDVCCSSCGRRLQAVARHPGWKNSLASSHLQQAGACR